MNCIQLTTVEGDQLLRAYSASRHVTFQSKTAVLNSISKSPRKFCIAIILGLQTGINANLSGRQLGEFQSTIRRIVSQTESQGSEIRGMNFGRRNSHGPGALWKMGSGNGDHISPAVAEIRRDDQIGACLR